MPQKLLTKISKLTSLQYTNGCNILFLTKLREQCIKFDSYFELVFHFIFLVDIELVF
jgi:hypothetical protein